MFWHSIPSACTVYRVAIDCCSHRFSVSPHRSYGAFLLSVRIGLTPAFLSIVSSVRRRRVEMDIIIQLYRAYSANIRYTRWGLEILTLKVDVNYFSMFPTNRNSSSSLQHIRDRLKIVREPT